jgi:hypothetical protein
MTLFKRIRTGAVMSLFFLLALLTSCRLDMRDQPRYEPYEASPFFADGASVRPRVADTVARGQLRQDDHLYRGRVNEEIVDTFPFTVTVQILERGRERYSIFCTPCHGLVGDGNGIVTEYGMRTPTSFHDPDLRAEAAGYYFTIITNGTRIMPSYASRIRPEDRWAIIAYIRALQLSQGADVTQLPADLLPQLEQTETITR